MARLAPALGFCLLCFLLCNSASARTHAPQAMSNVELQEARRHTSLAAPISLVLIGSGLVLVAVPVIALSVYESGPQGKNQLVAGSVLAGVGAATALVGAVWLTERVKRRSALDHEIERRHLALRDLRLTPMPLPGGAALSLSGTF